MVVENPATELAFISQTRPSRLSRDQLVAQIVAHNPTASATYLNEFSESELARYLDRLSTADDPESRWTRPSDEPGVRGYRRAG